jgi:CDP-diglyceride synthetase
VNILDIKAKFKSWLDLDLRTVLLHAVVGGIMGYISFIINQPLLNLVFALAILIIIIYVNRKISKITEEKKWWMSSVLIYLFMWMLVWTIFYNTRIA